VAAKALMGRAQVKLLAVEPRPHQWSATVTLQMAAAQPVEAVAVLLRVAAPLTAVAVVAARPVAAVVVAEPVLRCLPCLALFLSVQSLDQCCAATQLLPNYR
jgi:hypothetical protein